MTVPVDFDLIAILTDELRRAVGNGVESLRAENVFSDVAPTRRFDGVATLEVGELATASEPDVEDGEIVETKNALYLRAPSKAEARRLARFASGVVRRTLDLLKERGFVVDWRKESAAVYPDVEGGSVLESFCAEYVFFVLLEIDGV